MLASLAPVPIARRLPAPAPDPLRADIIRFAEDNVVQAALRLAHELLHVRFAAKYPDQGYSIETAEIHAPNAMYRLWDALDRRRKLLNDR